VSTRGFAGFVLDGAEKIYVTHGDSYPRGLGFDVLRWLTSNRDAFLHPRPAGVLDRIRRLRLVPDYTALTLADIERIAAGLRQNPETEHLVDDDPGDGEEVLRYATYDLDALLQIGIVEGGSSFPTNSRYCEWGYLIDVDSVTFEVYRGHQKAPHDAGRFADRLSAEVGFYPVALAASWPLAALPDVNQFEACLAER
jgi:hypothetical protein